MRFLERFLEFMLDIISQLATRRFFHLVFEDLHFLIRCRRSVFYSLPEGEYDLFYNLV